MANLTEEDQWAYFRQDTMKELVSFAIGCMMGRYSLDSLGLIYAHSGGAGFHRKPLYHIPCRLRRHRPAHRHRVV